MSVLARRFGTAFIAAAALLVFSGLTAVTAQETEQAPADKTEEKAEDRYAVPQGDDVPRLVQFIQELMQFRPGSQGEAIAHQQKVVPALKKAAERIQKLEKDPASEPAKLATRLLLQIRIVQLGEAGPEEAKKVFEDVKAHLTSLKQPEPADLGLGVQTARILEQLDHPLAQSAYETFGEILANNENEGVAMRGKLMLGAVRRMKLVGDKMQLTGTTVDGKTFNLDDLKGKVVLVDFWATWCGPCLAELPNIQALYDKYHDKGFEVVGISLDQDRPALEEYLKEKEIPWTTLHENDGQGQHPAALHYAVESIPFMVLVGRDGKVLSTEARGEVLAGLLEKQFADKKDAQ